MPVRPSSSAQPLFGSKRSLDRPVPSHFVDSPSAAPPTKKVRMNEIKIQKAENSEPIKNRVKDWDEVCAKYRSLSRKRR